MERTIYTEEYRCGTALLYVHLEVALNWSWRGRKMVIYCAFLAAVRWTKNSRQVLASTRFSEVSLHFLKTSKASS